MSVFYSSYRFPLSLLALEHFDAIQAKEGPETAMLDTLARYCGCPDPSTEDIEYFVSRLEELIRKDDPPKDPPSAPPKKSLGTAWIEAISQLSVDKLLLAAVHYDYDKAQYLYCKADRTVAMAVLDTFISLQTEQFNYGFECVLYGFGGGYKDDTSAPEGAIDLRNAANPLAALDAMFGNLK